MRRSITVSLLLFAFALAPVSARASSTRLPHQDVSITWDGEFDRAHGVVAGNGTHANPYVISGWTLGNLSLKDTDRAVRIVNNTITGTLTLNWIGHDIVVGGNDINDMRVNENVSHWEMPTAGTITHNTFTTVGQLRHYDGNFTYNTVGAPVTGISTKQYPDTRAVNFDGFNGAHFEYNTIYGYVDARLHGHHHSSGFGLPSHMHAGMSSGMAEDHTKRFHEVTIAHNTIYSSFDYALAYLDTNHDANDRTAESEPNPWLNAPHTHFTRVHILSNQLFGAGILVDVFNAQDEKHIGTPKGSLDIIGNRVTLDRDMAHPLKAMQGIDIQHARYVAMTLESNVIAGAAPIVDVAQLDPAQSQGAGIDFVDVNHAQILISGARISNRQFGVRALQFTRSVTWTVKGLSTTAVATPVSYDSSVSAPQH